MNQFRNLTLTLAAFGAALALFFSHHLDIGTGSAIVLTLGTAFFLAWVFSPKYGWIHRCRSRSSTPAVHLEPPGHQTSTP